MSFFYWYRISNSKKQIEKETMQAKSKSTISPWRFAIIYIFLMGLFLLAIGLEPVKQILDINGLYTQFIVYLTGLILKPFGIIKQINGSLIFLNQGPVLDVKFGCNGLEAFLIYSVAILAYPEKIKHKIAGIALGFLILQAFNILRIAGLALSAIYFPDYFEYIHIYVAQGIMIAIALLLFLTWLHFTAALQRAEK